MEWFHFILTLINVCISIFSIRLYLKHRKKYKEIALLTAFYIASEKNLDQHEFFHLNELAYEILQRNEKNK